jgi:CRISPR-associated protein Cas1
VHVLSHGARLLLERQQLVCVSSEGIKKSIPIADLRAVVIAARGASFSSDVLAAILDADAVVLHSNARYKPCGMSVPLPRVVSHAAFLGQIGAGESLNTKLWRNILLRKIANQAACLRSLEAPSAYLENAARGHHQHEGNCAKHYWRKFFGNIGWGGLRRREQESEGSPNHFLNYGYAVLSALCYRSLVVHGLQPAIGLHHRSRYKAVPLVHDFIEPFRAFVDVILALHLRGGGSDMNAWIKVIGQSLRDYRIRHGGACIKLMDAIDKAASSLARSYAKRNATELWLPSLVSSP